MTSNLIKWSLAATALFLLGLLSGWALYRCRPGIPEPPAPAIHQKDGSLILERSDNGRPANVPTAQPIKPAGEIPKGATIERNVEVEVKPSGSGSYHFTPSPGSDLPTPSIPNLSSAFQCPDVKVDLSLVRMKDKTQRVIASSPDGSVIGGLDVPVSEPPSMKPQRWTVQAMTGYDTHLAHQVFGGQASYARGPFTVSAGVIGGTAFVGAGIHF